MKTRYFKVEYSKATGGQVKFLIVKWSEITEIGEYLREKGNLIHECKEIR